MDQSANRIVADTLLNVVALKDFVEISKENARKFVSCYQLFESFQFILCFLFLISVQVPEKMRNMIGVDEVIVTI